MTSSLRAALAAVLLLAVLPASPAAATEPWEQVVDLTFPADPRVRFTDTFTACRSGCARTHQATDLMGERMWRLYATVDGVVCRIDDGAEDGYGRHLTVCGDDGRRYRYLHLNNDTPGTDDGAAALEHVYAPGIRHGVRVARGQHVAYLGDSGNAEDTAPHLHLDIFDDTVTNPYGESRLNPYPSLVDALARGDVPDGSAFHADPVDRAAGPDRVATALALAATRFETASAVVLAPSTTPGEAIVAGPLAAALDAPILVTFPDQLDPRVATRIAELGVTHVYLVGDLLGAESALAGIDVVADHVVRLGSADLFETAAAVAEEVWALHDAGEGLDGSIEGELAHDHEADPPAPTPALHVSAEPDRSGSYLLDGAAVSQAVHVHLVGPDPADVTGVRWWVDDPERAGEPFNEERSAPYDLAGTDGTEARGLDTSDLDDAEHTVTAAVAFTDGSVEVVTATFTVRNVQPRRAILALGEHEDPGRSWPDSLVAGYYGSLLERPVLLTRSGELPAATAAALAGVEDVAIVGGTAAVSEDVEVGTDGVAGTVQRLWGEDRYATAVAVVDDLLARDLIDTSRVWLTTGYNWPDAATAGPIVAGHGEALVLVDGKAAGGDHVSQGWLTRHAEAIERGRAIGGDVAVSDAALQAVRLAFT